MRLRNKAQPAGRQRQRTNESTPRVKQNYSYSQRNDEPNTGRQQNRSTPDFNYYLQRLGLFVLLLAVVASLTNVLTLSLHPKVLPLNNESSPFLSDTAVYEKTASRLLARSVWNRNKLTVDAGGITNDLVAQYPELAAATMTLPLVAHRPIIYVRPAKPVLVLNARNGAFIVADTGKALLRGDNDQALARYNLPPVTDQSGLKLQVGRQALSARDVGFVSTVKTELGAKGYTVESMTLPPGAAELDLKPAGQPYIIKFNLHSDTARQQAGTYLATINYLKKRNQLPAKYIDVRVDGRAYYQ